MESKKLQQLQQANSHLAPQKKIPLSYQTSISDYRTSAHSPVFHHQSVVHRQHQSSSATSGSGYQQSSGVGGGGPQMTPIDIQPQGKHNMLKHQNQSSSGSSPYHQQQYSGGEQIYQSPPDRTYQISTSGRPPPPQQQPNPVTALQQQYQQLQQAKIQAQIHTQNESVAQQQRNFALRQQMNPPIPQNHYHMSQSSSMMSSVAGLAMQQQQQHQSSSGSLGPQRTVPPSTLNLSSQFQPAAGPVKVAGAAVIASSKQQQHYHEQNIYAQQQQQLQLQLQLQQQQQQQQQHHLQHQQQAHQQISSSHLQEPSQMLKQQLKSDVTAATPGSEHSPVYIQQNHPGHVVNQACQTQLSGGGLGKQSTGATTTAKTPSSEDSSGKSPSHSQLDRKKSSGSLQALKSPITKRPVTSPVTLCGWLYKQGSDGLKVWRKRWFVLAEYCLYYYKGPEEEKLLGSILLPSYRVSACLPEDKIYRKFAFKCEHTNMRTYWLAAETAETMVQWVRALSAATLMQVTSNSGESDQTSQPSVSSSLNHSGENSDSGIHTLQSQQSKMSLSQGLTTPASDNGAAGGAGASTGGGGGGAQPLYANAPPKPRRINDGGYSSPSPEHSMDNDRKQQQHQQQHHHHHPQQAQQHPSSRRSGSGIMSPTLQQMQRTQHHAIYDTRTGNVTSTLRMHHQNSIDNLEAQFQQQMAMGGGPASTSDEYGKTPSAHYMDMEEQILRLQQQQQPQRVPVEDIYGQRELYMQKVIQQRYPTQQALGYANAERRTPDAYGRSKNRPLSDYEDIYNLTQAAGGVGNPVLQGASPATGYRRPLSPPTYDTSKHVPPMPSRYTPNHLEQATTTATPSSNTAAGAESCSRPAAAIIRPHSADFLEYEARAEAAEAAAVASAIKPDPIRAPRPKSSLDINRTPDSFYYSEASYAEKMRKSALYLQNPQSQQQQQASSSAISSAAANAQQQQLQQPQPQQPGYSNRQLDFSSTYGSSATAAHTGNGMNTIGYENPYERAYKRTELLNEAINNQGASSIPRMSRSMGAPGSIGPGGVPGSSTMGNSHLRSSSHHNQLQQHAHSSFQQQQQLMQSSSSPSSQQLPPAIAAHEQFLRSASARLPKRGGCGYEDDITAAYNNMSPTSPPPPAPSATTPTTPAQPVTMQDGERKREESMKRLLEWKQRMLQSPLTRKGALQQSGTSAMTKLGSNPNIMLTLAASPAGNKASLQHQLHHSQNAMTGGGGVASHAAIDSRGGIQRSRSETHANATTGYNSYSSDDEASISVRNVRNLPKGNLTVKPDPSDPHQQQHHSIVHNMNNYDQVSKLTNSYYGSAHDTKYAKTTSLSTAEITAANINGNGYYGTSGGAPATPAAIQHSTPLHPGKMGAMQDHLSGIVGALNGSIYDINAAAAYRENNGYPMRRTGSRAEIDLLERETSTQIRNLDMSAGDLLSRTHEELVLLLIQLRRQNSNTARAIEQCCTDIHEVQNRIRTTDGLTRAESIQRLDYLKQHLLDLERQYEKSKPLVNLVDNMVKLGSLYRNNNEATTDAAHQRQESVTLDRLEFNQRIQERRMLQEEQKQWDRLSPNHTELQSKVRQLYQLDQLLQEESGTLQNLQRDKEDLERALGGLRARIQDTNGPSVALDAAKKQQHILERELSRVHQLLAENSKKLEQTVAGNARLEQELLVLRQKLQASRGTRGSLGALNPVGSEGMQYASTTTAMLESELKRVQELVGDMQRQRQELSSAVRQLTENSNRLYQEIGNKENSSSSTSLSSHIKKRISTTCWVETDLDSMLSVDRTVNDSVVSSNLSTPLYVDTSSANSSSNLMNCSASSKLSNYAAADDQHLSSSSSKHHSARNSHHNSYSSNRYNDSDGLETSGVDSDGFLETNPFANLSNQEKQEIKTVRIVKRESERRHRDRERSVTNSTQNLDQVLEEDNHLQHNTMTPSYTSDDFPARSKSLPRPYTEPPKPKLHKNSFNGSSTGDSHIAASRSSHQQNNSSRHSSSNHSSSGKYPDYYGSSPAASSRSATTTSANIINPFDKNSNYSSSSSMPTTNHLTNGKDHHHRHYQHQPQQMKAPQHSAKHTNNMTPLANAYFAKHSGEGNAKAHRTPSDAAALRQKTESMQSLTKSITDLSPGPVFQSEAARQIINEMSAGSASEDNTVTEKVPSSHKHRRAVPREKRRHYTAPNNVNLKAMENIQAENDMNRNNTNWRARDDLDMEVALRPRMNAPDVVRSALGHGEKISENTIDNLLLAPNKIVIPERYIPEKTPELTPEEKKRRQEKVEVIKKMLSEAPMNSSNDNVSQPPSKLNAEKKQREHLLQLNQILAQQVMQMSKIVAGNPSQSNQK